MQNFAATPEQFNAMLSALYVNPERGTVRHRYDYPSRNLLAGDDAGYLQSGIVMVGAAGLRASRAQLIWFAGTGEIAPRQLLHRSDDRTDDRLSNLYVRGVGCVRRTDSGKWRAVIQVNGKKHATRSTPDREQAERDLAMMQSLLAA